MAFSSISSLNSLKYDSSIKTFPYNLTFLSSTSTTITISFSPPIRAPNGIGTVTLYTPYVNGTAGTGSGNNNSYRISNLTMNTTYSIAIQATFSSGLTSISSPIIASTSGFFINIIAGSGATSSSSTANNGDGFISTSPYVTMYGPDAIALDSNNNIYIADSNNNRVRIVYAGNGIINTVCGTGVASMSSTSINGDGGLATNATLNNVNGIAIDSSQNIYISDTGNYKIRMFTLGGTITTVVGTGTQGDSGDNGFATNANIDTPIDIAIDSSNNIYFADFGRHKIKMFNLNGIIRTVAGNGIASTSTTALNGDGGFATNASLNNPYAVACDSSNNIYIADYSNQRIRSFTLNGTINTVAGNGISSTTPTGLNGDGGFAINASLNGPIGVCVDKLNNIYIADFGNNRIRKFTNGGRISTVAGKGTNTNSTGDGNNALSCEIATPMCVSSDISNNLYVADSNNNIRKLYINGNIAPGPPSALTFISSTMPTTINISFSVPFSVGNITGYIPYVNGIQGTGTGTNTNYVITSPTNLYPSNTYNVSLSAVNSFGNSPQSTNSSSINFTQIGGGSDDIYGFLTHNYLTGPTITLSNINGNLYIQNYVTGNWDGQLSNITGLISATGGKLYFNNTSATQGQTGGLNPSRGRYLSIPPINGNNYSNGITISLWNQNTLLYQSAPALSIMSNVSNRINFGSDAEYGTGIRKVTVELNNQFQTFGSTSNANAMYHHVVTINNSGNVKFYQNGSIYPPGFPFVNVLMTNYTQPLNITFCAAYYLGGNNKTVYWGGNIGNFRIYSRELTASQITTLYNSTTPA